MYMRENIIKINNFFLQFQKHGRDYESCIGQSTSLLKSEISALFLRNIPDVLATIFPDSDYKIKPSIGQGRLTQCPWIAIMNKRETESTQKGVYIVFLLSRNLQDIYLTLAQGVTKSDIEDVLSNRDLVQKLLKSKNLYVNTDKLNIDNENYKKSIICSDKWDCFNIDFCEELLLKIKKAYEYYMDTVVKSDPFSLVSDSESLLLNLGTRNISSEMEKYLSAIYTKPFVLLAGISGTGKSRIVRQLARACDNLDENPWMVQKPMNFEMIQVKPNWHDSSELLGYVSRIDGERFVVGDFLKFIVKAWENLDTPFFLCLDEMNLAPVEQYFAEYLSVIESRRLNEDGDIVTDPIVKRDDAPWYSALVKNLTKNQDLRDKFEKEGISIPQNLIVMGTVNMDETTFSFSRKVLDRAMTIEMNEVDLAGGLTEDDLKKEQFTIAAEDVLPKAVEGKDVYGENKELCDKVIEYLGGVNNVLEGTPFKIAYRTRNEFLIYAVNRGEANYAKAMDEMTSMKILSRIEGDEAKMLNIDGRNILVELDKLLTAIGLTIETSLSRKKIQEMQKRLGTGYTSYWS